MYLDDTTFPGEEWLFGSTRSTVVDLPENLIYFWKVRLNPVTHDPDGTTLVCISFSVNFYYSYITSLRPKLEANGDLHLTYADLEGCELWYFIFNWTTGYQSGILINYNFFGWEIGELQAVFIGTDR